ncbi:ring canal kelch homolog isoform X2 [Eurytemora carolleeae]|uniref:ring canal kelch homolog isoform X2 n=1 Tax=Eurytemora carolleeae TaxID=1294199 RepID=UPI000C75F39D|nr:ring canal kelch homolog isoform X2 [Eurytemora carolleeae]|eukprot:XP_023348627.1 ring canal kelch homolog isoform X2 [Eurytemora affinis]
MILSIVSILFAGYLASCSRGSVSAETTAVLLGGRSYGGKTESYPCDVAIGDIGYYLAGLGAAVLNGQIVYCGGRDNDNEYRRNCFKNEGMDWIEFESMNVARIDFTLTTLGDKILAAGGYNSKEGRTATVEVFDGSSWKLQNYELTSVRNLHCAVPISESQVMLLGGFSNGYLSLVEVYSIEEGFIAELPSMPTARYGLGCSMFKGEIWTAGGYNGGSLDVVEVLTPGFTGGTWRSGPKLTKSRYYLTMEVLDNSLVVFGGVGGGVANSLEILQGEEWREEPLQYRHTDHASVSIPCN